MAVSGNQNYIIVVGGIDMDIAKIIEKYNPYSYGNPWEDIYNINEPIKYFSSVLIEDKLYLFGGCFNNQTTDKAWFIDLAKKELLKLPSMQEAKFCTTASVVGNYIFIIGGINEENQVLDTIEQWDIKTNTSKILNKKMTLKRYSHAAVVKDGDIYVIGGNDGKNVIQEVEFYSTTKNEWNCANSMNWNRMKLAAVGVENYIYAIGGSNGSQDLNSVERFNTKNKIWEKIAHLPFAVKGHSAVVDKSRIICFGDYESELVLEYIPRMNEWTRIGKMANKRRFYSAFLTNFKLESDESTENVEKSSIKISSNFKQEPEEQTNKNEEKTESYESTKNVEKTAIKRIDKKLNTGKISKLINRLKKNDFTHKNKTISEISKTESHKSPDSLSPPASTSVKITKSDNSLNDYSGIQKEILNINREKIALVGGWNEEMANTIDIYNGENKSWTLSENIGFNKCCFASIIVKDSWLLIIGGENSSNQTLTSVEYIDLKNGQKHPLKPLNQARQQFSAVTLRRNSSTDVYAIGGFELTTAESRTGNILSSVERWNSDTKIWETISPLKVAINRHSACVIADRIYVTGGCIKENNKYESLNKVQIYSVKSDSWTYGTQMNQARHNHSSAVFNGKLYVAGGLIAQTNTHLASVEFFDPISNVWQEFAKLPQPASGISLCCFENKLLCIGGDHFWKYFINVWEYDETNKTWTVFKSLKRTRAYFAAHIIPYNSVI
ncbi:uncharacterized protein LOC143917413 [Arctopsyche grandis]|uniref:uncharacterized protein LOC143917413 n=1 Tax=Arctopsyche grandis TaxID=121162 RepID=UPI00406D740C